MAAAAALFGLLFLTDVSAQTLKLKFDFEDAGATTVDAASGVSLNIVDGAGAAADLHGVTGTGVAGSGKALDFTSGASGANGPLAFITNSGSINFGTVTNFTATLWFKPGAAFPNFPRLFWLGTNGATDSGAGRLGALLNNGASNSVQISAVPGNTTVAGISNIVANQWNFLAFTWDGANYKVYTASEGSPVVSGGSLAGTGSVNLGGPFSFGLGNRLALDRSLQGYLDDVRFYLGAAGTNFLENVRREALPALLASATGISPNPAPVSSSVIISATVTGVQPLSMQWRFTGTNGATMLIPGATNSTYVIPEVQFTNAGSYSLIVSNNPGFSCVITNTAATLTVTALNGVEIHNLGANAPVPSGSDIGQLNVTGNTMFPPTGVQATGLNYYTDNPNPPGQTFTTGSNTNGYLLTSLFIKWGGIEGSHAAGNPYTLRIYSVSGASAALIGTYTNNNVAPAMSAGDWTKWIGLSNLLSPSTTYAYGISARNVDATAGAGYMQVGNASGNPYVGGQLGLFPTGSGTITFGATGDYDASFVAHLVSDGSTPPAGTNSRPPLGPFLNNMMPETAPVVSANWAVVPAFPNLVFTNLLGITPVPGTNLLCAFEREGRVWTFVNDSNAASKTLVLDISNQCQGWDDSGLLNLVFHPGFVTNGYMYLYYTWVTPGTVVGSPTTRPVEYVPGKYHDRLSRFTMANGVSSLASELVLVDQAGDSVWHNGSGMFFHPGNGFLYWTDGDDERGPSQIINQNLFAGVFRIDVDRRGGSVSHPIPRQPAAGTTANYYIPNNNPFVGQSNVLEEFFCLGLRSPHRMTIDPPTGRIFIGDVGNTSREEIDVMGPAESGLNFQWNIIEGLNGDLTPPYIGINKRPILDYTHAEGNAVIGGYVYRGGEFASELGGRYVFGDNVRRTIWIMDESTTPATKLAIATLPKGDGPNSGADYTGLSSFGLDANGEIYMCQMSSIGGRIYKLAHGSPTASLPLPTLLSQTGVFTNLATLSPNPALIPYAVNSPLWSDGAVKTRWMGLATNTFVNFAANGEWSFPNGTVFVKHFALSTNDANPSQVKRLETRLLVIGTNGLVYGAGYKWRPDGSDADLVQTLTNENIIITSGTGTRTQTWSYPGRADCLVCHTIPAGGVLGVKTRQLNGNFLYPGTTNAGNQLGTWNQLNLFNSPLNEAAIPGYSKLVSVTDTNAALATRVRSYLDANCAQCHRPGGGVQANFDARFDTLLVNQGIVSGPVQNPQGISNAFVVAPADLGRSLLYVRDSNVGTPLQMPPLAKNVIDTNYVTVLSAWINSLVPPTVSAIADVTVPAGNSTGQIPFTVGDASVPAGSLAVSGASSRTNLVPDANIVFGGTGANRTVTLTPLAGQSGSATITVRVDNGTAPAYETFVVTVTGQLVGWYKFEGNAQDSSGQGNHGTAGGGFSYVAGTVGASAINFNGTDGYVQIPRSVSNDFTLALWVKTTTTGGGSQWWAGKGLLDGEMAGSQSDFGMSLVGAKAAFGVGNPDTTIASTTSINDGNWHHVAATRDSLSGEVRLYIDGLLENSLVTAATGTRAPTDLRIGSIRSGVPAGFLAGSVDDARIYNYVMNANEIAALLNPAPVLAPISDRVIMAGAVLTITNGATDASVPAQTLTFSLAGSPPAGAAITSNGVFSWRPAVAQGGTTNLITVQVADNGKPVMTDTKGFTVIVNRPAPPALNSASIANGRLQLTISGDAGPDYTVLASTNLIDWIPVFTTNQPATPFLFIDPSLTNYHQRFYRVRIGP
jgi:uncharacterized repeat protein (TIGR03806 family)